MTETTCTIANARIVADDAIIDGSIIIEDGLIAAIERSGRGDLDFGGDYLLPGFVELHTDNFERCLAPRPGASWPAYPAFLAHDGQMAAAGVTTVFNALSLGSVWLQPQRPDFVAPVSAALDQAAAEDALRADHFLHLRVETPAEDAVTALDAALARPEARLISMMDHTPGRRQFRDYSRLESFIVAEHGLAPEAIDLWAADMAAAAEAQSPKGQAAAAAAARARALPLASHDDETEADVEDAWALGARISEFPTTLTAARAAREIGMAIVAGAPNVVRNGSLSGNVSARALAEEGLVDALSSDYAPTSLLHAVFDLADDEEDLIHAVRLASTGPADAAGLSDRGRVAVGARADFLRVGKSGHTPILRETWRAGVRRA